MVPVDNEIKWPWKSQRVMVDKLMSRRKLFVLINIAIMEYHIQQQKKEKEYSIANNSKGER